MSSTLSACYFTSEDPNKKVSKVHKCSICGHQFRLSIHLNSHVANFHEALKNRKCHQCGKVYADLNDLKLHRIAAHGAKLKRPKKLLNNSFKAFSPGRSFTPVMARRTFSIFRTPTPNRRFTSIKNFTPGSSKRNSSVKTLFKTSKTPKVGNRYLCIACGRTLVSKHGLKRYDFILTIKKSRKKISVSVIFGTISFSSKIYLLHFLGISKIFTME